MNHNPFHVLRCNKLRVAVAAVLAHEFPGATEDDIPWHVAYCEYDDMPYSIVLGDSTDAALRFDGYDISHCLHRFRVFGVPAVRGRMVRG